MSAHPRRHPALIVVDVQMDFCEGGSLAVAGGNAVANGVAHYIGSTMGNGHGFMYDLVVFTRDFHEADGTNGGHFAEEGEAPDYSETWPAHCVQGTAGADLHPSIREVARRVLAPFPDRMAMIHKGQGKPAYSGFQGVGQDDKPLLEILNNAGIVQVDVVGLALDYCVKATALDAAEAGFDTRVISGYTAWVDPYTGAQAVKEMEAHGIEVAKL